MGYPEMNVLAARSPIGSKGISIIPFGNGAERILKNQDIGCAIRGINFNIHERSDILRAAQEGIVFSFQYGMEIMQEMGMPLQVIRAGKANMFLSPVFRQTLASISGTIIELYNTDGSAGAARGAGNRCRNLHFSCRSFRLFAMHGPDEPEPHKQEQYAEAYARWKKHLMSL